MARRIWLVLAAVAALAVITGTGGFSAAQMDRGMTVNVAAPGQAYVGLYDPGAAAPPAWATEYHNGSAAADGTVPLLAVHNQFDDTDLDVTVTAAPRGATAVDVGTHEFELDSGDKTLLSTDVDCTGAAERVELRVIATGEQGSMHTEIMHAVWMPCRAPPTDTPSEDAEPTESADADD